jgi:ATP-dependent DNA helicase RecG
LEQLRQRRRVHASRNPLLVRVLASVGIMRDEGEGVPRIFEEMQESLLKQPEISVEAAQLAVVLYNEPVASGPTAEWQAVVSRLDLTDAQKQVLLAYPEGFTDEQYQAVNASDRNQARREIEDMMAKGVLSPPAPGDQAGSYRLSRDLRETAAWLEQRTPQLRAFFESHDRLTNADYREIFGVTRFAARHELARLVDEGILVQKGERKAAHYVAGAELAPKP